jgi:ribonuclease HI
MYIVESYTLKGAGAGIVLIPPKGDVLKDAIQLEFPTTNNTTEYKGLVNGLQLAKDLGIRWIFIRGDSRLVAKQVQKEYDCNNDMMAEYLAEVRMIEKFFDGFEVRYVPCFTNHDVDQLAWIASFRAPTPLDAIVEKVSKPSVKPKESISKAGPELMIIDEPAQQQTYDWMSLIKAYLNNQPPSITLKSSASHISSKYIIWLMGHYIDRVSPVADVFGPPYFEWCQFVGEVRLGPPPSQFHDEAVELTSVSSW